MQTIQNAFSLFEKIAGKQIYDSNKTYKLSNFVIVHKVETSFIIYNCLSKELLLLEKDEINSILTGKSKKNEPVKKVFVENWNMVPEDFDEINFLSNINDLIKKLHYKPYLDTFCIFPTTECNARCFYCFETGCKVQKMDILTADALSEYIINNSGDTVYLRWFGGEPLLNVECIDRISTKLTEANIKIHSSMVSNGYLFDEKIVEKAKSNWNLEKVQITLDGTEKTYNKVKNYIYKNENPFIKVIDNIQLLLINNIFVTIRLNADDYNIDDLYKLADYLHSKLNSFNNFSVVPHLLFKKYKRSRKSNNLEYRSSLKNKFEKFENYLYALNLQKPKPVPKNPRINFCLADNKSALVVMPNGSLTRCEHKISDKDLTGSIFTNIKPKPWQNYVEHNQLCYTCPLLPDCKRLIDCDTGGYICDLQEKNRLIKKMRRDLEFSYEKHLENKHISQNVNCSIADYKVIVNLQNLLCVNRYNKYMTSDNTSPDTELSVCFEEIVSDSKLQEYVASNAYVESNLIYRKLAEWLPLNGAFVIHSAVFDVDGTGIALAAHSGTGKTTHMLLWKKLLGDRLKIVNGDKPIVRFFDDEPETPYAYGTPWNGKEELGCNMRTTLKHICFIERAQENSCEKMKKKDVVNLIFDQVYMPKDPQAAINTLQLINRLVSCCKLWKIKCNMDIEAAETAYRKIFETEKENETEIQLCNK